jgi:FdhE protein
MTLDTWLARHPFLEGVARFQEQVAAAFAKRPIPSCLEAPDWNLYAYDFESGVPLLHSSRLVFDLQPAEQALNAAIAEIVSRHLPGTFVSETRSLQAALQADSDVIGRLIAGRFEQDSSSGLLGFLACNALARHLQPLEASFRVWRDEEKWLRNYCPMCGSRPAMAQLVAADQGRRRFLSCRCGTLWSYSRTGCPFCGKLDDRGIAVVEVKGEGGLRLEYCTSCLGYLKTYNGQGSESFLLADWTSMHLDVVAQERGLKRLAASLYVI